MRYPLLYLPSSLTRSSLVGIYGFFKTRTVATNDLYYNEAAFLILNDVEILAYSLGASIPGPFLILTHQSQKNFSNTTQFSLATSSQKRTQVPSQHMQTSPPGPATFQISSTPYPFKIRSTPTAAATETATATLPAGPPSTSATPPLNSTRRLNVPTNTPSPAEANTTSRLTGRTRFTNPAVRKQEAAMAISTSRNQRHRKRRVWCMSGPMSLLSARAASRLYRSI